MVDQNRIPLLEKFLQQAGGRDVKRLQKLVKRAGLDKSGRTLSADRQELRQFHSFWEVVVEALKRFPDTALRLIEKEPIDELLWRASLFNFLVDKRTPLLSLSELQDVTHSFVEYLEVNRVSLVRNGYPENYFPDSLWLNRNLSFLYYQKLPQSGGTRLLNEREISLHLLSPNDFVRLVLPKKDVVEREDLGVTAKKAAIEVLKEAGLAGQFSEEEITQLRNCREDLLEMKIAVLNTVERALERHDPDNLVLNCLDSIEERLDGDDVAFLLRLDKSYHNTDQINVRLMTRTNWERIATSITPRPGGLTDLLFAIGHYAKELRIGTFAKTWETLGYRYNPVNRIHYLDFVASSSPALVLREQIDKALNLYDRLAGEEEEFWKDYTREINDFLKTKSGERRLGRIVFRTKGESSQFKPKSEKRTTARFPRLKDLAWEEVNIAFISDEALKVKARDQLKEFKFDQIGFEDKRSGKPKRLWLFLQAFAAKGGELSWQDVGSSGMNPNQVQSNVKRLRKILCNFMGIEDDPFQPYRKVKAYQTKFTITADARALLDSDDDASESGLQAAYESDIKRRR